MRGPRYRGAAAWRRSRRRRGSSQSRAPTPPVCAWEMPPGGPLRRGFLARGLPVLGGGCRRAEAGGEDFDPFGELCIRRRRGVVPGEVQVVAAAVAGVAFVADPAEGRRPACSGRLGPEARARVIGAQVASQVVLAADRDEVDGEAVVVVGAAGVAVVAADVVAVGQRAGVAVGDVDRDSGRRSSAGRGGSGWSTMSPASWGIEAGIGTILPGRGRAASSAGDRRRRPRRGREDRERRSGRADGERLEVGASRDHARTIGGSPSPGSCAIGNRQPT